MNAPVALVRSGAVLRRLEGTERLVALGTSRFHCNFQVTSMVEVRGPVTLALLEEAALRVQQQHACLRTEVVNEPGRDDHWVFRETDALIRVEEVLAVRDEQWREVWDQLAHTPIDGLVWRLVWVRKPGAEVSQLLAGFHHSVSDIGSLSVFYDSLLRALDDVRAGRPAAAAIVPLHDTLSRVVRSRWPLRAIARIVWHRYFRRLRTMPFDHQPFIPVEQRRWAGPFRTIEPEAVTALVERCRERGLTLSHVLSAATLLEVADRVRVREALAPFDLSLSTSLDLRRAGLPGINPRQMGLMVTVVQTFYRPRANDDIWTLGARVKQAIDLLKARGEHRDFALMPNLFSPRLGAWVARQNHGRPPEGMLLVSNFGRLGDMDHGPFSAQRMFFTASQAVFGSTFLMASGTLRGRMFMHLGHPSPALSEATGASVMDGVLERMGVGQGK